MIQPGISSLKKKISSVFIVESRRLDSLPSDELLQKGREKKVDVNETKKEEFEEKKNALVVTCLGLDNNT